ncbi:MULTISPECIES: hypothetical protein [unclassified Serratia (in: enterobacteria)]|uniref:hypothetical protein n=1 Tax=unclassified Serratia (in: enterobacteria) TaxID=2647522 RepID=UPI0030765D79
MKKIIALGLLLGVMSVSVHAEEASQELKEEAQAVIRSAGYKCDTVNGAYPAHFSMSVKVFCDDVYTYIIRDKGGRYIVEIDD